MADIVYSYGAPPFPFGAFGMDDPFTYPLFSGLDPTVLSSHEDKAMVLLASPFKPNDQMEIGAPPFPFGEFDLKGPFSYVTLGSSLLDYIAHTHGLTTEATDNPSNRYIMGAFSRAPNLASSVFKGADPTQTSESSIGVIGLDDPDGKLDHLLDYSWDGAYLEIRRGSPSGSISSYQTVARLSAAGILGDANTKEIKLRDLSWSFTQVQLHGQTYQGTGGLEGEANLVGKTKPYAVGYNFNCTPALIDSALLIYQISFTSVAEIMEVRHAAVPWASEGDVATFADLVAATVSPASYKTCLAAGCFKLGSTPTSDVTVDLIGDNDTIDGQSSPRTRAQIVRRIATRMGGATLDESSQIDFTALSYFDQRHPAAVGFYWADATTKAEAINRVMLGVLGWWVVTVAGVLLIGFVEDPEIGSPTLNLSYPVVGEMSVSRLGEVKQIDQLPPRRSTFMGWRKNNTIQQASSMAPSVALYDQTIYGSDVRYTTIRNQWVINNFSGAADVFVVDSGFWFEADASQECQRQGDLFSKPRNRYSIEVAIDPLVNVLGQRSRIDNYNRLGFGAQKRLFCCGIDASGDTSVALHFWG
jgi:hypothetical protein